MKITLTMDFRMLLRREPKEEPHMCEGWIHDNNAMQFRNGVRDAHCRYAARYMIDGTAYCHNHTQALLLVRALNAHDDKGGEQ